MKPSDFDGPPGPGNPLASALRAAREHLAERGRTSAVPEQQPYPLLLVRPSGVMAYYAAREAIASWGSDFGYQLVEEYWQLEFPTPDLQLADVERRAIDEARTRLAWLQQVQSARVARQAPRVQYRAATTRGGVEVDGGPSVLGDQSRWEWREPGGDGEGQGRGKGIFGSANGDAAGNSTGLAGGGPVGGGQGGGQGGSQEPGSGTWQQTGQGSGGDAILGSGTGTTGAGYGTGGSSTLEGGRYAGSSAFASSEGSAGESLWAGGEPGGGSGGEPGGPAGAGGSSVRGSGSTSGFGEGGGDGGDGSGEGSSDGGMSSLAGTDAAAGGAGGSAGGAAGAQDGAAGGSGGAGMMSMGETGAGGPNLTMQADGSCEVSPLASSRGANWASMATRDRPVPLSRPVQIECDAHELRILDGSRRRVVKRVPLGDRTADAVDPLIYAVRQHVDSWGIAGDRMYWNPRLVLSATPQGASRRKDLEALLAGSGLITSRRDERSMAEAAPEGPAAEAGVVR